MTTKFWTHYCKEVGETQIPQGENCNWCDITLEEVEQSIIDQPCDKLVNILSS